MARDRVALPVLPRGFVEQLRREIPSLAAEILREIRLMIPEYDRPLDSLFSTGLLHGVETALVEFADEVEGRGSPVEDRAQVYRGLGRSELAEGRSMDSLQSALRLGGRLAWRRYARVARRVGMRPDQMIELAEAVFTHVDQIATASVLGYASAKADIAQTRLRRRNLLELVLRRADRTLLEAAAEAADWALPNVVACAALGPAASRPDEPDPQEHADAVERAGTRLLPEAALTDLSAPSPYLLLPEPEVWLGKPEILEFLGAHRAVLGPIVPLDAAADSLRWARIARERLPERLLERAPIVCDRRLPALLLLGDEALVRLIGERRLAPLSAMTAKQRERLEATLTAWLETNRGSAPQVAARLGIHPQTARSRLHRLQDLFGEALADPETRFEMEVALRGRALFANIDGI
ncbi:helix-turn-helix domain-containing protein [Actinospica sp. MGRD01-02]|uniref:Helix-turn-helix domain-containing protein n=1 Tax=Actinospica acidithermotolerans TaxID=2828514 RepID=A0A941E7X2_9ACTN|nr:helix-turn-helix domain-containing protein [Actinospica acidithermotolerans]MBR7826716.1 helix-turn-helix domain-containing protein [Actinospica acidithermotolerans]